MALGQYKIKVVPVLDTASLQNQLAQAGVKGGAAGKAGKASGEAYASTFGRAIKERFKYSIANTLIYGTQAAIKDMVKNVKELDAAQVELKKVSDLSGKSLEAYTQKAYKLGEGVAKTGTEIIQTATEFKKQGFDANTSLQLSDIASQFRNIADTEIDAATAAKFINSQLKAFGETEGFKNLSSDAEKATKVIDTVNEVANNFGVGTNDLQMALTKTGAALKGYGNSYGETIALITAGTEMLPNQASKVARGWRTIGANVLKLAQDEEVLEAANGKVNVALRDSNGEMRSTFDILTDLHKGVEGQSVAWKDLSQEEQSAISLMLAGTTQTEVFKSTMDNFTQALKANEVAQNAQGSAARENARYLDSIEGKMAQFKSAWEELSYHIVSSDMIKAFYDLATKAIKAIDSIFLAFDKLPGKYSGLVGMLGSIGAIIAAFKFKKILDFFKDFSKIADVGKSLLRTTDAIADIADTADDLTDVAGAVAEVGSAAAQTSGAVGAGSGGLVGALGGLSSVAIPLAAALIAVGGACAYAYYEYKNSFNGKYAEWQKLCDEIVQVENEIDNLKNKEGELSSEEESRLRILEMQLAILERQEAVKNKQLTYAFDKDAKEAMRGKTHKVQGEDVVTKEDTVGDKYLKALQERYDLEQKIKHLEDESRMHPLTAEQEKELEKYNSQLDKVYGNEYTWLSKLEEEHNKLAQVDYNSLKTGEGKGWYDNIHSAYLQAQTDVKEVQDGIAKTIETFGSAQFDSWNIDVSSLKSAGDLAEKISEKIKGLDKDEEITLYARDETGSVIDEITTKKSDLTDKEWEMVVNATTTGDYDKLQEYINSGDSEHKDILMKFIPEGKEEIEKDKKDLEKGGKVEMEIKEKGKNGFLQTMDDVLNKQRTAYVEVKDEGADEANKNIDGVADKKRTANVDVTDNGQAKKTGKEIDDQSNKKRTANVGVTDNGQAKKTGKDIDNQANKKRTANVGVTDNGQAKQTGSKIDSQANKKRTANVGVTDNGQANKVGNTINGVANKKRTANVDVTQTGASSVQSKIDGIKGKSVTISIFKTIYEKIKKSAHGKRKGEAGGMSWLGDEGTKQNPKPELVVGKDGAYLAGTQGWEMRQLHSSDIVYSHAQTKRLLGNNLKGFSNVPLPMYAKGKNQTYNDWVSSSKSKMDSAKATYDASKNLKSLKKQVDSAKKAMEKAKKAYQKKKKDKKKKAAYDTAKNKYNTLKAKYNTAKKKGTKQAKKEYEAAKKEYQNAVKARDKQRSSFDNELKTLEYNRNVKDWTDEKYRQEYEKLTNKYKGSLSTDQLRAYKEAADQIYDERARNNASRWAGLVGVGGMTAANAVKNISNATHLSADEKKDYKAQAYKASVEYNLKEYQNGKKTRAQILTDIQNYYKTRGVYDEEYYKMLDELREADKQNELKRLNELKDKEANKLSYMKSYAQQQKGIYDKQVAKEKEEVEELEKLVELQDKLNNAKKTMVKVYREGVGFVYEQDTQAIRDAQKALDDYNKSKEKSKAEQMVDEWQAVLDLFEELESKASMKELELKLGISGITGLTGGKDIGTNLSSWESLIKGAITNQNAYDDLINQLSNLSGADIEKLLGAVLTSGNHQISQATINSVMSSHKFAKGTLSAPSGFSIVGEEGAELRYLDKGSSIFPNSISKNLMEWGQYSPAQIMGGSNTAQNQTFNFDKIVLPNVHNADDFYRELQMLPNKAIQQSALRM